MSACLSHVPKSLSLRQDHLGRRLRLRREPNRQRVRSSKLVSLPRGPTDPSKAGRL